jgi:hypothetical protein
MLMPPELGNPISNACGIFSGYRAGVRATAMRNGEQYEENAAECRRLAAQMKNPKPKKQLDDMADVWDRLARQRRKGIVENNPDQT